MNESLSRQNHSDGHEKSDGIAVTDRDILYAVCDCGWTRVKLGPSLM